MRFGLMTFDQDPSQGDRRDRGRDAHRRRPEHHRPVSRLRSARSAGMWSYYPGLGHGRPLHVHGHAAELPDPVVAAPSAPATRPRLPGKGA